MSTIELKGKVATDPLYTGENSFAIIKFKTIIDGRTATIKAKGTIPAPFKGKSLTLNGSWVTDPKYGDTFVVSSCESTMDEESQVALEFLLSKFIDGITYKAATEIVEEYGIGFSEVFRDPQKLLKISDIGPKRQRQILISYEQNIKYFKLFELTKGALSPKMLKKIVDKYEDKAYSIIKKNPYRLIYDFNGIGYKKADGYALKMGIDENSIERFKAATFYILTDAASTYGHAFLSYEDLNNMTLDLLFPNTSLMSIYYKDVLNTVVPKETSEWDALSLAKLPKKNINLLLSNWNEYDENTDSFLSEKYIKNYNLSASEVDTIETYLAKRQEFSSMLPDIITEEQIAGNIIDDEGRIYSSKFYSMEEDIAKKIFNLFKFNKVRTNPISTEHIKKAILDIEEKEGHELGDLQIKAVCTSLDSTFSIITGGPGRGKTSIIKTIIKAWNNAENRNVLLMAPTGRASQRMAESTGMPAHTIQRMLLSEMPIYNSLIIIDEFSMVDMVLFYRILKAYSHPSHGNKFVLVGDVNQLESIGVGKVLFDLINSRIIPTTILSKCYRNSGSISHNVDSVLDGVRLKDLSYDNHFILHTIEDNEVENISKKVLELYKKLRTKYLAKDICLISCKRQMGKVATNTLNRLIQNEMNPFTSPDNELKYSSNGETIIYRVNDRVMHIKNNYSIPVHLPIDNVSDLSASAYILNNPDAKYLEGKGCFNGETGTIISVNKESNTLVVEFDDGKLCRYDSNSLSELTLSYACTVHKCQGSEYKAMVHFELKEDFIMLNRNLFYTAISRGKEEVHLMGQTSAYQIALNTTKMSTRNTYLKERVQDIFSVECETPYESEFVVDIIE